MRRPLDERKTLMEQRHRKSLRSQREQLVTLVNGWDPAGRLSAGGPRTEYDWLVDRLLSLLSQNASREQVAEFLENEIRARFGSKPEDAAQFATKAITWFRLEGSEGG